MSRQLPCIYLKLPVYVLDFIRCKYQAPKDKCLPVTIPFRTTLAGRVIYEELIPNPEIKLLDPKCFSSRAFNLNPLEVPEDIRQCLPESGTYNQFICISIPEAHWFHGRWIECNEDMTLRPDSVKTIRDSMINEFWDELIAHIDEWLAHPDLHPRSYYRENAITDFCQKWRVGVIGKDQYGNILTDPDLEETIDRQYKRIIKRKQKA